MSVALALKGFSAMVGERFGDRNNALRVYSNP